jgi:hypothetical protein
MEHQVDAENDTKSNDIQLNCTQQNGIDKNDTQHDDNWKNGILLDGI